MNTATLPPPAVVPARTIFRVFPLALPEPLDSQLARAGFAPWMMVPEWSAHREACRKMGEVKAYAAINRAYRDLSPCNGIGAVLWKTKVQELHTYADRRPRTHETTLWDMVEARRAFIAHKLARQLVEKAEAQADRRTFKRSLNRIAA